MSINVLTSDYRLYGNYMLEHVITINFTVNDH